MKRVDRQQAGKPACPLAALSRPRLWQFLLAQDTPDRAGQAHGSAALISKGQKPSCAINNDGNNDGNSIATPARLVCIRPPVVWIAAAPGKRVYPTRVCIARRSRAHLNRPPTFL